MDICCTYAVHKKKCCFFKFSFDFDTKLEGNVFCHLTIHNFINE